MTSYRLRNNTFMHVTCSRKLKMRPKFGLSSRLLFISRHVHLRKILKSLLETEKVSFLKFSQSESPEISRIIVGYPKQSNFNGRIYAPDTLSKIMKIMKSSINDFVEDCNIITFLGRFQNISNLILSKSIVVVLSNH